jgi:hypothetical protein
MAHQKLKTFLHRHNQLLTVIGALIVFVTYVVNDVHRERLKEMASSIAGAQSFLAIRADLRLIKEDVEFLKQSESARNAPKIETAKTQAESYVTEMMMLKFRPLDAILANANVSLDRASQLVRAMPQDGELDAQLQSLKAEGKALSQKHNATLTNAMLRYRGHFRVEHGTRIPDPLPPLNELKELDRQLDEYQKPIIAWANKSLEFASDVVTKAEQTREQAERNYKIYTRAGYFLYTLGWSLALVGKLGGVEGALGHE